MTALALRETQLLLWQLLTAPEGASAALAALPAEERATAAALVCGDDRLSAIERLDIYANMYFFRIRDALAEDFAAVHAVLGADRFHNLITDYLLAHPPAHFSLRYAGQYLPNFIVTHAAGPDAPWLGDLAALEWAILQAFDAADAAPLAADALARVPAARWPDLRLQLSPSLRVVRAQWAVHDLWAQVQCGAPPAAPAHAATILRVWRQDLRVFHRPICAAEAAALEALGTGEPFAAVCDAIAAADDEQSGATAAFDLLRTWLADAVLVGAPADEDHSV